MNYTLLCSCKWINVFEVSSLQLQLPVWVMNDIKEKNASDFLWVVTITEILCVDKMFLNSTQLFTLCFSYVTHISFCKKRSPYPLCTSALQSPIEYQRRESKSNSLGRCMRPPLSAASALRPHSSASIDRHKLPSLHSHNISLPTLYLPSQGQSQGPSETLPPQDVSVLIAYGNWWYVRTWWVTDFCLHLQPTVVQPCPADSHTVSPSHVQLGFTDRPNCQAVSNGLYTPTTQSSQVKMSSWWPLCDIQRVFFFFM